MKKIKIHSTQREEVLDITAQVREFAAQSGANSGLVAVFCPHTTAGISVNENADPDVKRDLLFHLRKTIPQSPEFIHSENNADSHIKAVLTGSSQVLIVENGKLQLGYWQGIYFLEFDGPREREFWLKFIAG